MAEYIEREAIEVLAKDRLSSYHDKLVMELLLGNDLTTNAAKQRLDTAREVFDLVKSIFPADVQEVKHGKWMYVDGDLDWADCKCSECGYTDSFEDCTESFYNFCPECGAKMDKECKDG